MKFEKNKKTKTKPLNQFIFFLHLNHIFVVGDAQQQQSDALWTESRCLIQQKITLWIFR